MVYTVASVFCWPALPRLEQVYPAAYTHDLSVGSALAFLSAVGSGQQSDIASLFFATFTYSLVTLMRTGREGSGRTPLVSARLVIESRGRSDPAAALQEYRQVPVTLTQMSWNGCTDG
jgi:hypothetical protein